MQQSVYLTGTETVERAASTIRQAAEKMWSAASQFDETVNRLIRRLDDFETWANAKFESEDAAREGRKEER
jgi:hypothetical protein